MSNLSYKSAEEILVRNYRGVKSIDFNEHKPKLFIGSSKEGLPYAEALQVILDFEIESTIWNQMTFIAGRSYQDSLRWTTYDYNFACFILSPDDTTISRGTAYASPRDNLIYEAARFAGALGDEYVYLIVPMYTKLKLPSDLEGTNLIYYDEKRENVFSAIGSAGTQIKYAIRSINSKSYRNGCDLVVRKTVTLNDLHTFDEKLRRISKEGHNGAIYIDIDRMTVINRKYTNNIGNIVIDTVYRICCDIAHTERVERLGDSFLVNVPDDMLTVISQKVIENVQRYSWASIHKDLYVTISCGLGIGVRKYPRKWLARAIISCKNAKKNGGNGTGEIVSVVPRDYNDIIIGSVYL